MKQHQIERERERERERCEAASDRGYFTKQDISVSHIIEVKSEGCPEGREVRDTPPGKSSTLGLSCAAYGEILLGEILPSRVCSESGFLP